MKWIAELAPVAFVMFLSCRIERMPTSAVRLCALPFLKVRDRRCADRQRSTTAGVAFAVTLNAGDPEQLSFMKTGGPDLVRCAVTMTDLQKGP